MQTVISQIRVRALVLLAAALVASGCARAPEKPTPPPVSLIREALVGQEFEVGSRNVEIAAANISALEVIDTDSSADGKSLSAVVAFDYASDPASFRVEGVVSFERLADGSLRDARFEANSAR